MLELHQVSVVLLAGGKGTRLGSLTASRPKPLLEVSGMPFINWVCLRLASFGLRRFIVSVGHLADQFETWAATRPFEREPFPSGVSVRLSCEPRPLGTGGGLRKALPYLDEWCLVANADTIVLGDLLPFLCSAEDSDCLLLAVYNEDASRYGTVEMDSRGVVTAFREKCQGSGWINAGLYVLRTSVLARFEEDTEFSIERDLVPSLLASGASVRAIKGAGVEILDIGTPESLRLAPEVLRSALG